MGANSGSDIVGIAGERLFQSEYWSAKITAAEAILNRGWGKAKETMEAAHRVSIEDLVLASMRVEEERKAAGDLPNLSSQPPQTLTGSTVRF